MRCSASTAGHCAKRSAGRSTKTTGTDCGMTITVRRTCWLGSGNRRAPPATQIDPLATLEIDLPRCPAAEVLGILPRFDMTVGRVEPPGETPPAFRWSRVGFPGEH